MAKKAAAVTKRAPKNPTPKKVTEREMMYTDEQIIRALKEAQGMVGPAARIVGCDPTTIYDRIKKVPAVAQVKHDAREMLLDTAELAMLRAIQGGEAWAVCFALKTIGKHRGYVERQEVTTPDGITIRVVRDKKPLPGGD
jgi:hypothetical protein